MKEIHLMLDELNSNRNNSKAEINSIFTIKEHPARELDEYMKEQYITLLFSIISETDNTEKKAIDYLFYLMENIGYTENNEAIVKNVYKLDAKKLNDCAVSFANEEIRYLLCLESMILVSLTNMCDGVKNKADEIYGMFDINKEEKDELQNVMNVIIKNSLTEYKIEKYNIHNLIYKCYLHKFDFSAERVLVISNCLKMVRNSDSERSFYRAPTIANFAVFAQLFFESEFKIEDCSFVKKGQPLGRFLVRLFGACIAPISSSEEWERYDQDEKKYLSTPLFKSYDKYYDDFYDTNTYRTVDIKAEKTGVFFLYYTLFNKPKLPVGIISHPLDNMGEAEKYYDIEYDKIFEADNE